jgi:hypothetical protein
MNARVIIFAMFSARNIIKEDLEARGIKLSHVPPQEVTEAAKRYLAAHPELLEQAKETLARQSRLLRSPQRNQPQSPL